MKKCCIPCTVHHDDTTHSYIGINANTFKSRYNAHKSSFNNKHLGHSTSLCKYIWDLKAKTLIILTSASAKRCNLCIQEKIYILYKPQSENIKPARCNHQPTACGNPGFNLINSGRFWRYFYDLRTNQCRLYFFCRRRTGFR